jgi:hypothetical protein
VFSPLSTVSTSPSTMSWIAGRSSSSRFIRNSPTMVRRSRAWSGGSIRMNVPGPGGRTVIRAGNPSREKSELKRLSARTAQASAWPVISHTSLPSKSRVVRKTGCSARNRG